MSKKSKKEFKGKNLIAFPDDYTVIDLETTGYSAEFDFILEVCALRVRNGKIVDKFCSLVNTPLIFIKSYVEKLTGITQNMIDDAPDVTEVLPEYFDFIGDDIVVGHNVNYDVNFLYEYARKFLNQYFKNDFIDTLRISRRLNPDKESHRLVDLIERFHTPERPSHRSEPDCIAAFQVYNAMKEIILKKYDSPQDFVKATQSSKSYHSVNANDIVGDESKIDSDNLLFDKVCVFTGKLDRMTRAEAFQMVADIGGHVANSVTAKTNFLIMGNYDYCASIKEGKSSKQKKAEDLKLKGKDIEIIPEDVFYDIFED